MTNMNFEAEFIYQFLYWKAIFLNVLVHRMGVGNSGDGSGKDGGK